MSSETDYERDRRIVEAYDELLDEIYPTFKMGDLEFWPSDILKSCDPIAYQCALSDYEDSVQTDEDDEVIDNYTRDADWRSENE